MMILSPVALPTLRSAVIGLVVPMATWPALSMTKEVAVEEPTTNWLLAAPATGLIASDAQGVVVPMATLPEESMRMRSALLVPKISALLWMLRRMTSPATVLAK